MDGDEVVQVYIRDVESSQRVPLKALKGFKKVKVPTGESKTVEIKLPYEAFCYYDTITSKYTVEKGVFEIMVGNSSANITSVNKLKVAGGIVPKIKVGQKSGYYNAKDPVRTKKWDYLYKDSGMSSKSKDVEDNATWVEYEIMFNDPGFYVNTWDAELTFDSATKEAIVETSMAGAVIKSYTITKNQLKLPIKIPIPPEYGKPVRLRVKTVNGEVKHKSIKIIPPGNKETFVITKVIAKSE